VGARSGRRERVGRAGGVHRRIYRAYANHSGLGAPDPSTRLGGDRRQVGPLLESHPAQAGRRQGTVGQPPVPAAADAGVGAPGVGRTGDRRRRCAHRGLRLRARSKGFGRRRAPVDAVGCAAQASRMRTPGCTATAAGGQGLRVPPTRPASSPGWQGSRSRVAHMEAGRRARRCGDCMTPDLLRCGVLTRRFLVATRQGRARCLPRRVAAVRAANQT